MPTSLTGPVIEGMDAPSGPNVQPLYGRFVQPQLINPADYVGQSEGRGFSVTPSVLSVWQLLLLADQSRYSIIFIPAGNDYRVTFDRSISPVANGFVVTAAGSGLGFRWDDLRDMIGSEWYVSSAFPQAITGVTVRITSPTIRERQQTAREEELVKRAINYPRFTKQIVTTIPRLRRIEGCNEKRV